MQFEAKIPTELMNKLNDLSDDIKNIEDRMLAAATDVLKPEIEHNLRKVIRSGYETGVLAASVSVKKKRTSKEKANIIYFKGSVKRTFKNGKTRTVRNNLKAAVLEYGKQGQPPRPFLRPAVNAKREAMVRAMEETFNKETQKYT